MPTLTKNDILFNTKRERGTTAVERIIIIGSCGAGKSTLAISLAKKLELPLVHLDRIRFVGSWQERTREEFDEILLCFS